jgi:exonuclease III
MQCTKHQYAQVHKTNTLSIKEKIGSDTIVAGDLNTSISSMTEHSDKKLTDILELKNTMDETDLTDIYRAFHLTAADYTFFSAAYGTFSKIHHILGHQANFNHYKKQVIPCILTDHNEIKTIQTHGV